MPSSNARKNCTHPDLAGAKARGGAKSISLPVAAAKSAAAAGGIRKSRSGPWRATVLIALNLLMAAHVVQWLIMGRTVSPIEPSESMYTLELGQLNAGFIFFTLALLATFVLGRWVCGWGCHVVALQDLCGWAMKKCGVKPRPFRSRLLAFVPLIAGLYMFVWPTAKRLVMPWIDPARASAFPGFENHLTTSDFWATFAPWYVAIPFLAICGFATVYALGAKGFCTYACPYGGFFSALDRFAVGRIRVTDACEGCGHCTAVCTSNVQVHREVRDYGMVVDPGCMKCLDCVSVCPNEALYYGLGKPRLGAAPRVAEPERRARPLPMWQEALAAAAFLAALLSLRGLYDALPFLMALGCAAIFAFMVLKFADLLRAPTVGVQNLRFKTGGRLRPAGIGFAALTVLAVAFVGHSGVIRWNTWLAGRDFEKAAAPQNLVLAGANVWEILTPGARAAVPRARGRLEFAERWGLVSTVENRTRLAWLDLLQGRYESAATHLRQAARRAPDDPFPPYYLARVQLLLGRPGEAAAAFRQSLAADPDVPESRFHLGNTLAFGGDLQGAMREWARLADTPMPESATAGRFDGHEREKVYQSLQQQAQHNLGGALAQLGRFDEAAGRFERALSLNSSDAQTHAMYALVLRELGRDAEARMHAAEAARLEARARTP